MIYKGHKKGERGRYISSLFLKNIFIIIVFFMNFYTYINVRLYLKKKENENVRNR